MIRTLILTLALCSRLCAAVWAPPATHQGNWEPGVDIGVEGGIDQYRVGGASARTNLRNVVTEFGADNTGATDAKAAIQAAVDAAAANDVVYLPAGTYKLQSAVITNKDNFTIRGAPACIRVLSVSLSTFTCAN